MAHQSIQVPVVRIRVGNVLEHLNSTTEANISSKGKWLPNCDIIQGLHCICADVCCIGAILFVHTCDSFQKDRINVYVDSTVLCYNMEALKSSWPIFLIHFWVQLFLLINKENQSDNFLKPKGYQLLIKYHFHRRLLKHLKLKTQVWTFNSIKILKIFP